MNKLLNKLLLVMVALSMILSACKSAAEPTATSVPATKVPDTAVPATVMPGTKEPTAVPATKAPTPVPPTATPEPPPTPAKPVNIELWASGRVSEAAPPSTNWVAYQIIKDELNINLKLVLLPSTTADQDTKINTAGAANALPDIFFVNRDTWYKLVQAGLIAKVDELLPLMPVRTETHYSDAALNKLVTLDGAMYGLPDPGQIPMTDGLVVRKDWLDKLGLQAPATLEQFMEVAKAFTFNDPDGNGQNDTYGFCAFIDGSGLASMGGGPRFDWVGGAYGVAGVWNLNSADSFGLNARSSNYMMAMDFIKQMNEEGVIDPDWPTLKKDEFRARWKQGKCGMMHENFAALANKSNYKDFDTNFPDGEWVVLAPPTGPDGASSDGTIIKSARIYAVSQKAMDEGKGPAIAKLLEWMANEEGYYLLGFGVKGINYNLDANGFITLEGLPNPALAWTTKEMQPMTQLANMVYIFTPVEMQARYVAYKTANGRPMDPKAYLAAFQSQPYTEATGAAIINPPSNAADFTRYYSEGIVQFVLGQKELNADTWAEFISVLDSLGAKELEAAAKASLIAAGFLK